MNTPEFGEALRALDALAPSDVTDAMHRLARRAGVIDMIVYLVDFEQAELRPVPDRDQHVDLPTAQPVTGTRAGQAFAERRVVTEAAGTETRTWVPILEGSECTGVLALTMEDPGDGEARARSEELGMLAGAIISITARQTDLFNMVRRTRSMSLAASMQWDLLPPLHIQTPEARSTGLLEPAYDVGGDAFDHAVNGYTFDVAIMDAMGHGLRSSLASALAVGSYRHDRREGQSLAVMHRRIDEAMADRFRGDSFVTGQLAQLDVRTGRLSWTNAGHPWPLLVRGGRVVDRLGCRPSLPWGLGGPLVEEAEVELQPADKVVLFSDGVVDGRSTDDTEFGIDRFVGLVEEAVASRRSADVILRTALHHVSEFQSGRLRDDATIVILEWLPAD